jgi:hypothetical protein
VNQVGFSADKIPMYQVVDRRRGITAIVDKRAAKRPEVSPSRRR